MVLNIQPTGQNQIDISLISSPGNLHNVKTYDPIIGWFAKIFGIAKEIHDEYGKSYIVNLHSLGKALKVIQNEGVNTNKMESLSQKINNYFLERKAGNEFVTQVCKLEKQVKIFWENSFKHLFNTKKDWEIALFIDKALKSIDLKRENVEKSYEDLKSNFLSFSPNNPNFNSIFLNDKTFQEKLKILKGFKKQLTLEKSHHPYPREIDI